MKHSQRRALIGVLLCGFASAPLAAAADNLWRVEFIIENDLLLAQDRHYSNGLFLNVLAPMAYLPSWIATAARLLPPYNDDPSEVRWGFAVGHEMYTPEDYFERSLIVDDRPYAGWLFARFELYRDRNRDLPGKLPYLDSLQVDLGVVGPAAIAEEAQSGIHAVFFSPKFEGWDNQLRNEVGLILRRGWHWRIPGDAIEFGRGFHADAIANLTLDLGNVKTAASAGVKLRGGWRLPKDFGLGRFAPAEGSESGFRLYLFVGVDVSAVARDIFLDGNTFRDSHEVDKKTFVIHLPMGVAFACGRFRTSLSASWNSEAFKGQQGADWNGRWSLGWDY